MGRHDSILHTERQVLSSIFYDLKYFEIVYSVLGKGRNIFIASEHAILYQAMCRASWNPGSDTEWGDYQYYFHDDLDAVLKGMGHSDGIEALSFDGIRSYFKHFTVCPQCQGEVSSELKGWAVSLLGEDQEPVSRIPQSDYHEYINSYQWREKATMAKENAGQRCQVCNGDDRLEAHHRTYERLGFEEKGDITVLCRDCHQVFHDNRRLITHES